MCKCLDNLLKTISLSQSESKYSKFRWMFGDIFSTNSILTPTTTNENIETQAHPYIFREVSVFSSYRPSPDCLCPLVVFTSALIIKSHQRMADTETRSILDFVTQLWSNEVTKKCLMGRRRFSLWRNFDFSIATVATGLTVVS